MLRLQERDIKYLKLLARFGVLNKETVNRIYENHERYARYRRKDLADEGYILKNNSYSYLGSEGKKYINNIGIPVRNVNGSKETRNRIAKIGEIMLPLEKAYEIHPSWEIKTNKAEMKALYYGSITRKLQATETSEGFSSEYYIYNIGKLKNPSKGKKLKQRLVYRIREEIKQNVQNNKIDRVIIFAEDGNAMSVYKEQMEDLGVKEQLLLPLTDFGIELLILYGTKDVNRMAAELIYGKNNIVKSELVFVDYKTNDGINIIVMINNDMEKVIKLRQYKDMYKYNTTFTRTKIELLCLENQKESLEREIPRIPIRTVKLEDLV
ncbi:hypothetical protein [Clostridium guangxiense]|uniref:hypothetical protein n=1 Tax=Clostridium guangxiense TaxID=1662055 RepID=UPI001E326BAB|nr:hypothetical protein [Clostridium guangxiense]MCD2345093.1 hypothetical protein [Clostridium guangxiense]